MEVIEFLATLISKKTLTPNECGIYDLIKRELPDWKVIYVNKNGVKNAFFYKDFGADSNTDSNTNSSRHLCLAGHIDVVPSGEGWERDPFGGEISDGIIYGRGAQDMKGGVASAVFALKNIKKFNGILSLLLTSDEEGDGVFGTKIMLEHLREIGLLPHFALVAEPTCERVFGDTIKIGRRGSINGILEIEGIQGHAAYPQKCLNPIDLIAPILPQIAGVELDSGDENFSASKIVVVDIRAGLEVSNVTPSALKLMFNVRNNPQTTQDSIKNYFKNIMGATPYSLKLSQTSFPFITDSRILVDALNAAITKHTSAQISRSTSGGTSDARHFSAFGVEVVEFGLLNDKIHAINECVKVRDVEALRDIFIDFIKNLDASK